MSNIRNISASKGLVFADHVEVHRNGGRCRRADEAVLHDGIDDKVSFSSFDLLISRVETASTEGKMSCQCMFRAQKLESIPSSTIGCQWRAKYVDNPQSEGDESGSKHVEGLRNTRRTEDLKCYQILPYDTVFIQLQIPILRNMCVVALSW